MIRNHDRSGWFGASDTSIIMGSWDTATFREFWAVKTGLVTQDYTTRAMDVGNIMEHSIIDAIADLTGRRIRKGRFPTYRRHRLRVNYDGLTRDCVIEVKTSGKGFAKVPLNYWRQCQALMYAKRRKWCELWLYTLTDFDYEAPYYAQIDPDRLTVFLIGYDPQWIKTAYLPRLRALAECLKKGVHPCWSAYFAQTKKAKS